MSNRSFVAMLTAIAATSLVPLPVAGQARSQTAPSVQRTPQRTPDGHPDLQGIWTMATYTPLQRPANLAGKEFFTEEETANLTRLLTAEGVDPLAGAVLSAETDEQRQNRIRQSKENIHYDNAIWLTETRPKSLSSRRTSLIVDPPDGKIPALTADAQKREADRRNVSRDLVVNVPQQSFDGYETRTFQERCIVWRHEGPPMLPPAYNDRIQIFQTPEYVVIHQEVSINAVRIIPLDGRPHLSLTIRQWPGDSRGRWEGDTLVVDTTNFNHRTHFEGSSEGLHVVERFTHVDADTIRYEFTVDDPTSWTRSWRAEIPMARAEGLLYEYACHEGNHDLPNILEIARNIEAAAANEAKKTSR